MPFSSFLKTDDGTNKQRTPPNSTGTSLSPLSSSYLSRLSSSNDNSPIRTTNTIRLTSPPANKQADTVTFLLKQAITPAQLIQVKKQQAKGGDRIEKQKTSYIYIASLIFLLLSPSVLLKVHENDLQLEDQSLINIILNKNCSLVYTNTLGKSNEVSSRTNLS